MIQVIKKKQETVLSLLKRFNRKVKQSGHIIRFKKNQFKKREKSQLKKKRDALRRQQTRSKREELYKLGKIDNLPR